MERLARFPRGTLMVSVLVNGATTIAILGFGAPTWLLLLSAIAAATISMGLDSRVAGRSGRR